MLGVSANTVRRWTDSGRIAAHRSPGGHRRYLAEDVYALMPEDDGGDGAQPGDFAQLRRQSQDLRAALQAGLDLMSLLADDPGRVPAEAARALCDLTGAPRCDVYLGDRERLRLVVSLDGGELDSGRPGVVRQTADWSPVEGDPASTQVVCLQAGAKGVSRRGRLAMQRRGCRSLAWAPIVLRGEFAGAIELSDAGERDFARHADIIERPRPRLRGGRRRRAHVQAAGAPRQERPRAGGPLAGGGAEPRLRALRAALRGAAARGGRRAGASTSGASPAA